MKIAICASEGAPYAKSGGLGDVMEALPAALARIPGNEVVLILPYYQKIKQNTNQVETSVLESSGANYKINLLNISFGISFYIPTGANSTKKLKAYKTSNS